LNLLKLYVVPIANRKHRQALFSILLRVTLTAIKRVKYTQVSLQLITVRLFIWRYAIRKKRAVAYATRQGPKYALLIYKNATSKYLMLYIMVVSEAA
jgi:hypothetical protein